MTGGEETLQARTVDFGRTQNWLFPNYASGPEAFGIWAHSLEYGRAEGFGVAYNAAVWSECRQHAVGFLEEIAEMGILPEFELNDALRFYRLSADALCEVSELFPFFGYKPEHIVDAWRREKAIDLLHQVRDAEAEGLNLLEKMVGLLNAEVAVV